MVGVPVEGVYYAEPCLLLDSESESDEGTDDAVTVIFRPSPYSSPAPVSMTPQPPSPEASSPPPPPRPPPPANYEPPAEVFSSLPRNWRQRKQFLFDS